MRILVGLSILGDDPVVRREIDLPEGGRRLDEFDAELGAACLDIADVNDAAIERFLGGFIGNGDALACGHGSAERNQGAMGVDDESARFFLKRIAICRDACDLDRDAQEHAHAAAAAGIGCPRLLIRGCRHWGDHDPN